MLPDLKFDELFFKYRFQILFFLIGLILIGLGVFLAKGKSLTSSKIEVLENATEGQTTDFEIVVEIAGSVEKPGVYRLANDSRVEDLLVAAGGVAVDADRNWMEKSLNRAAKLIDGQKIYIPAIDEQPTVISAKNFGGYQTISSGWGSGSVNINTASAKELESLWGIGPITAQNIIEQRPYSTVEELLSRKILKKNVYEKNKEHFKVY